jgi:hypothetical protein
MKWTAISLVAIGVLVANGVRLLVARTEPITTERRPEIRVPAKTCAHRREHHGILPI